MNIGKKIIYYRKIENLTQEELAEKMNISSKTISKWERGCSIPSILSLIELSKIFHIKINELIDDE